MFTPKEERIIHLSREETRLRRRLEEIHAELDELADEKEVSDGFVDAMLATHRQEFYQRTGDYFTDEMLDDLLDPDR